ncbi:MAG: hypothetical protein GX616_13755 [Planctomycetes bacterium]|nr:hypothetical protein [Planctomycetota bacterium]
MPLGRLILSSILFAITTAPAAGQFSNVGLFGGEVRDIAACSTDGSTELFVAVAGHHAVYRCGQTSWEPVMEGPCTGIEIEADRTAGSPDMLWVVKDGRLFTHRLDAPWDKDGWALNKGVSRADTLFGHLSGMYIGGDGTVYRTTDGGRMLSPLAAFSNERIRSIAVYNQTLFYVVSGKSLYRCLDDGNGFVSSSVNIACEGVPAGEVLSVAIDPNDPRNTSTTNRFFAVCGGKASGLYRTEDAGATWTRMPISAPSHQVLGLAFLTFRGKQRMIAGQKYSDDFGRTWSDLPETIVATSLGYVNGYAAGNVAVSDPADPNFVYFATNLAVGQWNMATTKAGEIHNAAGIDGLSVLDIARIPDDALTQSIVWAATDRGLGKTMAYPAVSDGGEWLFPIQPQGEATALTAVALRPGDLETVLAGNRSGTIYRTTTGGSDKEHWSAVFSTRNPPFSTRYSSPESVVVTAIRIVDKDSTIVYASTAVDDGKYEGTVYRSLNNGTSWDDDFGAVSGQSRNMPVNDLVFLDNMVWAAVGNPRDPRPEAKGLYTRLSITGGADWWKLPTGTDLDGQAVLAVDGVQVGSLRVIYAATEQSVFCGRLDGATASTWSWKSIAPNGAQRYAALAADPGKPNHVLVAHDDLIWCSSDGGGTWGVVPSSRTCDPVLAMLHDHLLIGTNSGLFAASDEAFDPAGRIRTSAAVRRRPTTRPSGAIAGLPPAQPQPQPDLLPFKLPRIFGLGIADTVGIWLPLLAWLAIARHNRSR